MSACVGNQQDPCYDVATIIDPPYVMAKSDNSSQYEGLVVDLLDKLATKTNIRYRLKVVNGTYGHEEPHGTWTGLIGSVVTIPADMAAGAIAVTPERERVLRFTETFHSSSVQLLLPRPTGDVGPGAALLLAPFSPSAWVLVLLAFVIVSIGLFLVGRYSPCGWARLSPEMDLRRARHSFNLRNSFLFTVSTLTWQGYREAPRSLSGRVLAVSWWLFVVLVLIAYICNLTALVSHRPHLRPALSFRTYEDILRDRTVDVAMIRHGDAHIELGASHVSLERRLSEYAFDRGIWVDSLSEGLQRMRDSTFDLALLVPTYRARHLTSYHCDLITHGRGLGMINYAFGFPAGSFPEALVHRIDAAILEMRESGELEELIHRWDGKGDDCPDPEGKSLPVMPEGGESAVVFLPIGPSDLAVPLLLLFFCGVLATCLAVLEIKYAKNWPKQDGEATIAMHAVESGGAATEQLACLKSVDRKAIDVQQKTEDKMKRKSPEIQVLTAGKDRDDESAAADEDAVADKDAVQGNSDIHLDQNIDTDKEKAYGSKDIILHHEA